MSAPKSQGRQVIEAALTRWTIAVLGLVAIATATIFPWFSVQAVDGSADMAGWGAWRTTGDVDASLRPLPLGVLVYLSAGLMVASAVRRAFGVAVVGAMATFAAAILPFMITRTVDRRLPGGGAVAVEVAAAPLMLLGIGFAATIVCWIGYARCVLRPPPRAEA
ncbi:hypothetical protein [Mycolicibacterium hodleri]|uniref:Uncharacterized protein n=1 Tax=Mycolicibacterium hodleri TaxID=49897 RepID=A0A502DNF1_9MYCO|nr:hypothetical protein [Mycolicibacterium hodleri]TPG25616.1 hypothetical protein EAH80_29840 [Mycolicibacterium hodleri]